MPASSRLRAVLWPTLAALVVAIILAGLGTWQMQRLAWKEALIARVVDRLKRPPVPLPSKGEIDGLADEAVDYLPVRVAGTIATPREFHVFGILGEARGRASGPGWWVVVPVDLPDGSVAFVNRGFVPDALKDPGRRTAGALTGPVTFTGLLRGHDVANLFTPADDIAGNRWYVRDPARFAAAMGLDRSRVYPVTIDMDAASLPPGGLPQPGETLVTFPNSHLGYAITWYGLMLTALGVWAVFVRRNWREAAPG